MVKNHPNRSKRITASSIVRVMQSMQSYLKSVELRTFREDVAEHLDPETLDEAGAVMRGTLMYLTVMHGLMYDCPSLLTHGCDALEYVQELIAAVDIEKLSPGARQAFLSDCDRMFGDDLTDLPPDIARLIADVAGETEH